MFYKVELDKKGKTEIIGKFWIQNSGVSKVLDTWLNNNSQWTEVRLINSFTGKLIKKMYPDSGVVID